MWICPVIRGVGVGVGVGVGSSVGSGVCVAVGAGVGVGVGLGVTGCFAVSVAAVDGDGDSVTVSTTFGGFSGGFNFTTGVITPTVTTPAVAIYSITLRIVDGFFFVAFFFGVSRLNSSGSGANSFALESGKSGAT